MKKSELIQIIREEIQKLSESYNKPAWEKYKNQANSVKTRKTRWYFEYIQDLLDGKVDKVERSAFRKKMAKNQWALDWVDNMVYDGFLGLKKVGNTQYLYNPNAEKGSTNKQKLQNFIKNIKQEWDEDFDKNSKFIFSGSNNPNVVKISSWEVTDYVFIFKGNTIEIKNKRGYSIATERYWEKGYSDEYSSSEQNKEIKKFENWLTNNEVVSWVYYKLDEMNVKYTVTIKRFFDKKETQLTNNIRGYYFHPTLIINIKGQ